MKTHPSHLKVGLITEEAKLPIYIQSLLGCSEVKLEAVFVSPQHQDKSKKIPFVQSVEHVLQKSQVVIIANKTEHRFQIISEAIRNDKPIFVDSPMVSQIQQAKEVCALVEESVLPFYVHFPFRSQPIVQKLLEMENQHLFIDIQQHLTYESAQEKNLIYDILIHHLDWIMWLAKSPLKEVHAKGYSVRNKNECDVVNVQITFFNMMSVNVVLSRLGNQEELGISLFNKINGKENMKIQDVLTLDSKQQAVFYEHSLQEFFSCIKQKNKSTWLANEYDGLKTLELADIISTQIEKYVYFYGN